MFARLHYVFPTERERFFLRWLLQRYAGRSFGGLKEAAGGERTGSFQEAARACAEFGASSEGAECMAELVDGEVRGRDLRDAFVTLLCVADMNASELMRKYGAEMSADLLKMSAEERAYEFAVDIKDRLALMGKTMKDVGLEQWEVEHGTSELERERRRWCAETCGVEQARAEALFEKAGSEELKEVYEEVCRRLDSASSSSGPAGRALYVGGGAGRGKTVLGRALLARCRARGEVGLAVASTGLAALNYAGGWTAHSLFKIRVRQSDDDEDPVECRPTAERAELLRAAHFVLWDEVSMAHAENVAAVDALLRDVRGVHAPFGGLTVLFLGDMRQIPPVVTFGGRQDTVEAAPCRAESWRHVEKFELTQHQRMVDAEFAEFVDSIGDGCVEVDRPPDWIALRGLRTVRSHKEALGFVFPDVRDEKSVAECAYITPHCVTADVVNAAMLERVPGQERVCYGRNRVLGDDGDEEEGGGAFLDTIEANSIPPTGLALKVGAMCMLMRNLSRKDGLMNNLRVMVRKVSSRYVYVQACSGGKVFPVPRVQFKLTLRSGLTVLRTQFPLRLAYALTCHRSQGQTFARAAVDVRGDFWSHGQLYVALSRVRTRESLRVVCTEEKCDADGSAMCRNVVWPELLAGGGGGGGGVCMETFAEEFVAPRMRKRRPRQEAGRCDERPAEEGSGACPQGGNDPAESPLRRLVLDLCAEDAEEDEKWRKARARDIEVDDDAPDAEDAAYLAELRLEDREASRRRKMLAAAGFSLEADDADAEEGESGGGSESCESVGVWEVEDEAEPLAAGYRVVGMPPDGDCLFWCLVHGMGFGGDGAVRRMREELAEAAGQHRHTVVGDLTIAEAIGAEHGGETVEMYTRAMKSKRAQRRWGGHIEMLLAHLVYGCGVEVYVESGGKMYMSGGEIDADEGAGTIRVVYRGASHYDFLELV